MQNTTHPQHLGKRNTSSSTLILDLCVILVMCAGILAIVVTYINYQKLISTAEDKISAVEKSNNMLRSLIANQRSRQESLKNEKVVEYAKANGMVLPGPGEICIITPKSVNPTTAQKTYRQRETKMASLPRQPQSNRN